MTSSNFKTLKKIVSEMEEKNYQSNQTDRKSLPQQVTTMSSQRDSIHSVVQHEGLNDISINLHKRKLEFDPHSPRFSLSGASNTTDRKSRNELSRQQSKTTTSN